MYRDIEPGPPLARPGPPEGRSVIAVIGINEYARWPRLDNAVGDALGVSRLFQRLGFVELTPPLLDGAATSDAMRRLVTDDLARLSRNDSLVVFFAGHGHTHRASVGDVSVTTGCVIPADAAGRAGNMSVTWLRLDSWLRDIALLRPHHILVILDACHSGLALRGLQAPRGRGGPGVRWRGAGTVAHLDALRARRSRRIITSALDDQRAMDSGPVPGHSLFTGCLIEGLSGRMAAGGQRVATGSALGVYMQERVAAYSVSTQTPAFGPFELDDGGEIVMPLLCDDAPSAARESTHAPPLDGAARSNAWTLPKRSRRKTSSAPSSPPPLAAAAQRPAGLGEPLIAGPRLRPPSVPRDVAPAPPPPVMPAPIPAAARVDRICGPSHRLRTRAVELAVLLAIVGIGAVLGYAVVGALSRGAPVMRAGE